MKRIRKTLKQLYWRAYGLFLTQPPVPPSARSLLFICKGNICRSPFAEAMAQRRVPEGARIICRSAGIVVETPQGCPRDTLVAAEKFGIDLSRHQSRQVDRKLVEESDMIFAMEVWHFRRLRALFPKQREKIFLLPLFEENPREQLDAYLVLNIRDPYGRSSGDFIECFERIDACLKGAFSTIKAAAVYRLPNEETETAGGAARR